MSTPPIYEVPSLREIIVRENILKKKLPFHVEISLDVQKIVGSVSKDIVKGLPSLKDRVDPANIISSLCLQVEGAVKERKVLSGHSLRSQLLTMSNPFLDFEIDLLATTKSWLSKIPAREHLKNTIQEEISQFIDALETSCKLGSKSCIFP